ncbi:sn-glycerol-3-phosphate import ATP-binding protein UgpC [Alloyangia pacifica]|uniref:sn-glycerol 3-phosphate transport system ATP-binding protein n=1 Tax=Alloyangia pacifica TaxID=311180 RepID=A0A1I6QI63_9RHOB|nr:sn-glycerol-3-phosphate import ATP-binding protein UgpC [Alloyangia pacifica]SDF90245.1 sn-glycerol 3-phosphate transport system ATP-binding protein [Alloyangia pacifica]SFS52008.1 sn-glycerol 3-phosphate transport system ATP-binding protein [Alloyangia pacifica]
MAELTLKSVGKTYAGGVDAVSDVNIDIKDGEFIVLVGPSGCGKSTLLRMVAGLETVTRGDVHIGGRRVNDLDPAERDIAMVFQNYALYPHMSVRDNMAYGLKNRGESKAVIEERVAEAARMLELGQYLDRKPRALSGGQRQRVAMGRAIVRQPSAFLFDEPLSNLDAKLRVSMRMEIRKLQQRLGTTSLYVTHDQLEAMTLADRLVVLNGGRVEQIGAPLEVYRKPASTFVASFIGAPAMSLLDARIEGGQLSLAGHALARLGNAPGPVTLGLRAEDLRIVDTGLPMRVEYVEELGAQRIIHGMVGDQALAVTDTHDTPLGPEVRVAVDSAKIHLFDAQSGRRMDKRLQTVSEPAE